MTISAVCVSFEEMPWKILESSFLSPWVKIIEKVWICRICSLGDSRRVGPLNWKPIATYLVNRLTLHKTKKKKTAILPNSCYFPIRSGKTVILLSYRRRSWRRRRLSVTSSETPDISILIFFLIGQLEETNKGVELLEKSNKNKFYSFFSRKVSVS